MGKDLSEMSLEELWELFPIVLKEHNPDYKEWYQDEKAKIINAIGDDNDIRIHHIGSSAIEGLIAKPTVDILLEINRISDIDLIKNRLVDAGWTVMSYEEHPDFKMSLNKGYTPSGFAEKVFHLHVRFMGDWNELYFRDYLLLHKDIAEEYGRLKLELIGQYEHNRDGYTEAKTEFILKHTKLAREEFGARYVVRGDH